MSLTQLPMHQRAILVALVALACEGKPVASQEQALTVPPGFRVTVFAQNLNGVRYLTLGPGGTVYASRPSGGDILRFVDANHDGVADTTITVVSGLNGPFGLAFRGDTTCVDENTAVGHSNPRSPTQVAGVP